MIAAVYCLLSYILPDQFGTIVPLIARLGLGIFRLYSIWDPVYKYIMCFKPSNHLGQNVKRLSFTQSFVACINGALVMSVGEAALRPKMNQIAYIDIRRT